MGKQLWDERRQRAIAEVQATIKAAFPEAKFKVSQGTDPGGIYIDAYTRADDGFEVLDLISERLVDLCVEKGLGIYVAPLPKEEP
jgi:hypothetical protein